MAEPGSGTSGARAWPEARRLPRGLAVCVTVALAASYIADLYGGPVFLYALLFGMAINFLGEEATCRPGVDFAARTVLRVGVALLGVRITAGQILDLGWEVALLVLLGVTTTILAGLLLARVLGLSRELGLLTGGAVAICGVAAALALASVLPRGPDSRRHLLLTVVGVTTLSTVAMVLYPLLAGALALDERTAGVFLGGTIHDVAQVVGAGFTMSPEAGETATVVKLMRVVMLVPVVLLLAFSQRGERAHGAILEGPVGRTLLLPPFLLAFLLLAAANSLGWIPIALGKGLEGLSHWALVTAIAALGLKTSLAELTRLGWRPLLLLLAETILLAGLFLSVLLWL